MSESRTQGLQCGQESVPAACPPPSARRGSRDGHCRPGWWGSALGTFTAEGVADTGPVTRGGLDLGHLSASPERLFLDVALRSLAVVAASESLVRNVWPFRGVRASRSTTCSTGPWRPGSRGAGSGPRSRPLRSPLLLLARLSPCVASGCAANRSRARLGPPPFQVPAADCRVPVQTVVRRPVVTLDLRRHARALSRRWHLVLGAWAPTRTSGPCLGGVWP